jgi:hypothetical protein
MNSKEIAEMITVANQCEAKLEGIRMEFLAQIVINTNEIVAILRSQVPGAQMELPLQPPVAPKVEEPAAPVVAKPAASKKPVVAKAAPVAQPAPAVVAKPSVLGTAKAEVKAPTKDEVMTALINFIGNHAEGEEAGEEALGVMLKELGNYNQFPEVPADKYAELLEKINQA